MVPPPVPPPSPPTVESRLADVEKQIDDLKKKPKDGWDKAQVWVPVLSTIVSALAIAGSAWFFSDRVKAAFQERELRLNSVKDMRDLLVKMGDSNIDPATARAEARALSAFGTFAVAPLIAQLEAGTNRRLGAKDGLRAVGIVEHAETCKQLEDVIKNRSGLFQMGTHQTVIELLGILHCDAAVPALESYQSMLQSGTVGNIYGDEQPPSNENIGNLKQALSTALQKIRSKP